MSGDVREFAITAATALRSYASEIEHWHRASYDPNDPDWTVMLDHRKAEDMLKSLLVIAGFLETMFEEGGS